MFLFFFYLPGCLFVSLLFPSGMVLLLFVVAVAVAAAAAAARYHIIRFFASTRVSDG